MSEIILVDRALCLPAPDVEALINGRIVAAIPRVFIEREWSFVILSIDALANLLPVERQYRPEFLPTAKNSLIQLKPETIAIKAWGKCESCTLLHELEEAEILSQLTGYSPIALKTILQQRQHLFLACLRIYRLPEPFEVPAGSFNSEKVGKFLSLLSPGLSEHISVPIKVEASLPVLSEAIFNQRKQQLADRKLPLYPQIEALYHSVTQLAISNPEAKAFEQDLKVFLGWTDQPIARHNSDLAWIKTIADVGNSSEGHAFEKLVRRGLLKLGFRGSSLNPDSTGGAGGMDFYCEEPYPVVGECKATKSATVSDRTAAQLLKIGMNHLGKNQYERSIKLIVAAGELNFYALRTATENEMNVIRPETLQSLVEMQTNYMGSIDLIELQHSLQKAPFGLADEKVGKYLDVVRSKIKVRSQIVQAAKQLTEPNRKQLAVMEIRVHYNAKFVEEPSNRLNDDQTVHELLIELSSPLTGYLGRVQGTSLQTDRFYFLRDLPMD